MLWFSILYQSWTAANHTLICIPACTRTRQPLFACFNIKGCGRKRKKSCILKTWCSLVYQCARENQWIVNSGLCLFIFWGFIQAALGRRANAVGSLSQVHRTARLDWMRSLVEPYLKANLDVTYAEPLKSKREDTCAFFGNRLLVLKAPGAGGEKGVLFVMFSEMFSASLLGFFKYGSAIRGSTQSPAPTRPALGFCQVVQKSQISRIRQSEQKFSSIL